MKEVRYHLEHTAGWVIRLGDGTDESHRRMQDALDRLWPYAGELFESRRGDRRRGRPAGSDPTRPRCGRRGTRTIDTVLAEATLSRPDVAFRTGTGALRRAQRASRLPARRDAVPAPAAPGSDLVTAPLRPPLSDRAPADLGPPVARPVVDPEIPVLTIADLGILRDVVEHPDGSRRGGHHPDLLRLPGDGRDPRGRRGRAGRRRLSRRHHHAPCFSPAWTTDWMTDDGRRTLREYGIAPPTRTAPDRTGLADPAVPRAGPATSAARSAAARAGSQPVRLHRLQVA